MAAVRGQKTSISRVKCPSSKIKLIVGICQLIGWAGPND